MTRIIHDFPPNIRAIAAAFPIEGRADIVYAYGDAIYNPHSIDIPPSIVVHEEVHLKRQYGDPEFWWSMYLSNPGFRFDEELRAHQAEYRAAAEAATNRHQRRATLAAIAKRLSSPLYGSLTTLADAKELVAA